MKRILIIAVLTICFGCVAKTEVNTDKELRLEGTPFNYKVREFEYDGCQYVAFGFGQSLAVTYKGNCKYCQQRNK